MDRFNDLGRGLQLMLIGAVLLLIDTFLNWQSIDTPIGSFGQSAWHGVGGVLLGLLVIVLLAWLLVRLAAVDIPIPVSATLIAAFLAFLILIIVILKTLVDDYSAWPSYVGIVLAVVIAVGAWMQIQATGGVDSLRTEATSLGSSMSTSSAAPATTQPAAPAPPPPPPAPVPEEPSAPPPGSAASGTTDAASDATSDEPSTERDT
jgi:uncharacterized membrane protein YhdT